jgi:hypothetical protein
MKVRDHGEGCGEGGFKVAEKFMHAKNCFVILLASLLVAGAFAQNAAAAPRWVNALPTVCKNEFPGWNKQYGWKAFVVSNIYFGRKGRWQSCGLSWNAKSKSEAISGAMRSCRKNMRESRAPKSARCTVRLTLSKTRK